MYKLLVKDNGLSGEIIFHGDLTIQNADSIKSCLLNAIEQVSELSIDHQSAAKYDITYLQLLITLNLSATMLGKTIKYKNSASFIAYVKDSGLSGYNYLISPITDNTNINNTQPDIKND